MSAELRFFKVEKDGPVVIWKFKNPPRNLLTIETHMELIGLVEAFEADPELRAAILTSGVPGVFIQHFDVSSILDWAEEPKQITERLAKADDEPQEPVGIAAHGPKPIICAINGLTGGGGCELALTCDIRIMSREAVIGQPEVRAGFPPGGGGTQRLARFVGVPKALELCLSGRMIEADEAERIGLVNRACDPDELMPIAIELAKEIAANPPLGVAIVKQCIYEGSDMSLKDGLALEKKLFFEAIQSEAAMEIMRNYVAIGQNPENAPSED
ncbi:MAG: enoyl-CoA hydratase/isomerase family protein [Deltaproteobacteria bacterium]|nr:enoyl-CoA hydratase/isomerase family protein [Deltaproteobacteria bacterium]MBW2323145.1 enoyl-CoA hydratase/isomerase family protein [Deltaproteobacteria bacterium]